MCTQRKHSLDSYLSEISELKERMRQVFPSYIASLKELSSLPEEFERRFWASHVKTLLQTVKADYDNFQAQAQKVDFLGQFMTLGIGVALKAGGMQPIAPPPPMQLGIVILPSGEIKPTVLDERRPKQDAILLSIDRFEAIAQRLMDVTMKGEIVPESEEEIPKLVYSLALKMAQSSPEP